MIEYLPLVLTGLGLTASIIYYANILSNANKTRELQLHAQEQALETRQAQMFMQIYNQCQDPTFTGAYNRITKTEIKTLDQLEKLIENEQYYSDVNRVGMFYEGLGVLVKEGYVSIRLVALLMTGMTRRWWEGHNKNIIEEARKKWNFRRLMSESEYLYNELIKYIEENPELKTEASPIQ